MTIRLLSPDLVRNRCDEVSRAAAFACFSATVPAFMFGMAGYPKIASAFGAAALVTIGLAIGAQLVARMVR